MSEKSVHNCAIIYKWVNCDNNEPLKNYDSYIEILYGKHQIIDNEWNFSLVGCRVQWRAQVILSTFFNFLQ